jgi:Domain of unknown function (DUF4157)
VQRKEHSASSNASPNLESRLNSSKGGGNPLPDGVKSFMEPRFGTDFSQVRTHTDSAAVEMNQELQAQAFTHGNDVYFKAGKTPGKNELTAHELTHTLQQKGNQPRMSRQVAIQFKNDVPTMVNENTYRGSEGIINRNNGLRMDLPVLRVPDFKKPFIPSQNLVIRPGRPEGEKRETAQRNIWDDAASTGSGINSKLDAILQKAASFGPDSNPTYFLQIGRNKNFLIGTRTNILKRILRPYWTPDGGIILHEVDHQLEYQLNGEDKISNLWLLEKRANLYSGIRIEKEIEKKVINLLSKSSKTEVWRGENAPDFDTAKRQFNEIRFNTVEYNLPGVEKDRTPPHSYTLNQIKEEANQLNSIHPLSLSQVKKEGLLGTDTRLVIFNNSTGGRRFTIELPNAQTGEVPFGDKMFLPGFEPSTAIITPEKETIVALRGQLFSSNPLLDFHGIKVEIPIRKFSGLDYTGKLNIDATRATIEKIFDGHVKGLSPIHITSFDIEGDGLMVIRGKVITSVPLIDGADIDIVIRGNDVRLEKTFSTSELKVPGPIKIPYSSLTVAIGTETGFSLTGEAGLIIPKIGKGAIRGVGKTGTKKGEGDFALEGEFNFDSEKFDPALIAVRYSKKEGFGIGGKVGIKEGTIPGVKDALLQVNYANDLLSFAGLAHLSVPGIDAIALAGQIDDKGNFAFTADVNLKAMKGIKSGNVKVTITSKEGDEGIKLRVKGNASPDFPSVLNLNPELSVLYDNGIFKVETTVKYKKGRFEGTINVGVTNQAIDDKGKPQGEPNQAGEVIVFGFGELTVDIFKGNKGTIKVRLTPDREVLIAGEIVLNNLSPFGDGVKYDREIFVFPQLEIPLVGLPGLSVSAFISGGVHFSFNWQPLMLKQLKVDFKETNIKELENVQLDITGSVGSIATAEVYMSINAGLKARALIATLRGSLGGEAGLGVTAEAGGDVHATWNMEKGLQLKEIMAHLDVTPRAIFRLTGDVSVDLDLWVTSVNLYYHKWIFAEKELDMSGLTLKANFPISFDEKGDLIKPEFDKIDLEKPNFTGEQGKDVLNKAINGDAEKELAAKKEEIRTTIKNDLRNSSNKDFTPTKYTQKMKAKYKNSPELQEFVIKTIEDESRVIEYEEFDKQKNMIRQSNTSLASKLYLVDMFNLFNSYVTSVDIESFKAELIKIEEDEKLKAEQDKQIAEQTKQEQLAQENASKPKSQNKKASTSKTRAKASS